MNVRKKIVKKPSQERPTTAKVFGNRASSSHQKIRLTTHHPSEPSLPDLMSNFAKNQSIRGLIRRDRQRVLNTNEPWNNSRDISYLKDKRGSLPNQTFMGLPTEISALKQKHESESYSRSQVSPEKNTLQTMIKTEPSSIDKLYLGNPSGRQQIENLSKWYSLMNDKYANSNANRPMIDQMCMKEIIRQVTVHCIQRGQLLKEVVESINTSFKLEFETQFQEYEKNNDILHKDIELLKCKSIEDQKQIEQLQQSLDDTLADLSLKNDHISLLNSSLARTESDCLFMTKKFDDKNRQFSQLMKIFEKKRRIQKQNKMNNLIESSLDQFSVEISRSLMQECTKKPDIENKDTQTEETQETVGYSIDQDRQFQAMDQDLRENENLNLSRNSELLSDPSQDIYDEIEQQLKQSLPQNVDFESWKSGVILGLQRGRQIGLREGDQQSDSDCESESRIFRFNTYNSVKQMDQVFQGDLEDQISEESDVDSNDNDQSLISPAKSRKSVKSQKSQKSQKSRKSHSKFMFLKRQKTTTKFSEFNWHRRHSNISFQKKICGGDTILNMLEKKSLSYLQQRGTMSRRRVNRIIIKLFQVFVLKNNSISPVEIVYEEFSNIFGLKAVTDRKFVDLICSCFKYCQSRRKMFLRFMGLGDKIGCNNYSKFSIRIFVTAYEFLFKSKIGINVPFRPDYDVIYVPAARAIECVKEKLGSKVEKPEILKLLYWIEVHVEPDQKKTNPGGLIDIDKFFYQMLECYQKYQSGIHEGLHILYESLMSEHPYITHKELFMLLNFVNDKRIPRIDFTMQERYSFDKIYDMSIGKCIIGLSDVNRAIQVNENVIEYVKKERERVFSLLYNIPDHRKEEMQVDSIRERLEAIEEQAGVLKSGIVYAGWRIYANEVERMYHEIVN